MKTMTRTPLRPLPLRGICMLTAVLLFALSVYELLFHPNTDASMWRGLALGSLYLVMYLTQRRLFASRSSARQHLRHL